MSHSEKQGLEQSSQLPISLTLCQIADGREEEGGCEQHIFKSRILYRRLTSNVECKCQLFQDDIGENKMKLMGEK